MTIRDARTSSGAHPASCSVGTGVIIRGLIGEGVKLTTHLHLVLRWRMNGAVPLLHPMRIPDTDRENFTFLSYLYGVALLDITGKFSTRTGRFPNLDSSHSSHYKHKTFSWNQIQIVWLHKYSRRSKLSSVKLCFLWPWIFRTYSRPVVGEVWSERHTLTVFVGWGGFFPLSLFVATFRWRFKDFMVIAADLYETILHHLGLRAMAILVLHQPSKLEVFCDNS